MPSLLPTEADTMKITSIYGKSTSLGGQNHRKAIHWAAICDKESVVEYLLASGDRQSSCSLTGRFGFEHIVFQGWNLRLWHRTLDTQPWLQKSLRLLTGTSILFQTRNYYL
jgi:hypothetical protein